MKCFDIRMEFREDKKLDRILVIVIESEREIVRKSYKRLRKDSSVNDEEWIDHNYGYYFNVYCKNWATGLTFAIMYNEESGKNSYLLP